MLMWRCENGIWFGNGYRVEQISPSAWALLETTEHRPDVGINVEPSAIATLPTLAACKYQAEALHEREMLSGLRRRLAVISLGSGLTAFLFLSNPIVAIALAVVAGAAALELVATWLDPVSGSGREVIQ